MTRARNSANLASHGNLFVDITNDRTGIGSVVPDQNLHVAGTAGFHADVTFTGDLYNTTWDRSDNSLKFGDNSRLKFGNTEDALHIYHDSANVNYIISPTNRQLQYKSDGGFLMRGGGNQMIANFLQSAVTLYQGQQIKLTTVDHGINVTGTTDTDGLVVSGVATVTTMNVTGVLTYDDVTSVDSVGIVTARQGVRVTADGSNSANYISVGAGNDLQLFHNGSNSHIRNNTGILVLNADSLLLQSLSETYLSATANGAVQLYYDNSIKFATSNTGVSVTGAIASSGNLSISNVAPKIFLTDTDSNSDFAIRNMHGVFGIHDQTNSVDRLVIGSNGNVLIGTTSDSTQKLTLYGTNAAVIYQGANTGTGVGQGFITGNNGNVNGFVWNYENGFIHFGTNGAERLRILSDGKVLIGHTGNIFNYKLAIFGTDGGNSGISASRFSNNPSPASLLLSKSRSATIGNYAVLQNNDEVGMIDFRGADGSDNMSKVAEIKASIDGTPGSNDMPGRLTFHTTADGASTTTERLRIASDGQLTHTTNKASDYTARFNQAHADNPAYLEINGPTDNNIRPTYIQLSQAGTKKWAIGQVYASTSDRALHFCSGSSSQSNSKFVITTAGRAGIGTINPTTLLHIDDDSADPYLRIGGSGRDCGIQLSANANYTAFRADGANRLFVNAGADSIRFSIGGTSSSNEKLRITSTGALQQTATSGVSYFKGSSEYVFGSDSSSPPAGGSEGKFQVHDHKTRATLSLNAYMNNAGAPVLQFVSSRSGTKGTLGTKAAVNDYHGDIRFMGDNGTNYNSLVNSAQILARQKSTISDGDTVCAGELTFITGTDSAGSMLQRLSIDQNGRLTLSNSEGIVLSAKTSVLYALDGTLSYYSNTNGVYLNGAGSGGWLRLNASGVNNDRTSINLTGHTAANGDTINFKTNSTERLRIKNNGLISIANPSGSGTGAVTIYPNSITGNGRLDVYGGGDENNQTQARNEVMRIGRGDILDSYYHSIWSATGSGAATSHFLKFYVSNGTAGATNQVEALSMNGVGQVTMPNQPSFLAEHGHNSGNHKQKNEIYYSFIRNFQHVRHNTGNCYSNSTGKFTAPSDGMYIFHIDFTMDGGDGNDDSAGCYFRVENNSANYNRVHSSARDFHSVDPRLHSTSTGYEVNASFHTIEKLAAGATVGFYFTDWDYTDTRITTCFFSGYKVG